ncbi:receptor-type tyrosine-protein phosphatase F isoform X3 [Scomber scombrus]
MNSAGTRYSAPANLYVRVRRVPPRFIILPTNQEVILGGSVNLTCVAVGSPMPYVKWMEGGEDLTKEEEMPMGRNVLEVTNIRESANYTCMALSSLGIIEVTAQVTVKVSYQALTGEDTERHEVAGIGAEATSYVLEGLEKWTEYQVWVRAHTDVRPGPESAPVRMRTKEDVPGAPPRKLEVEAVNSTAIRVTWKPPLQVKQHGQIRGYQVIFSRLENGEPRGQPNIMDVALPEAQCPAMSGEHEAAVFDVPCVSTSHNWDHKSLCFTKLVGDKDPSTGRWYYIVVVPVSQSMRRWNNPDEMHLDEVSASRWLIG